MRILLSLAILTTAAMMMAGCGSSHTKESAAHADKASETITADTKTPEAKAADAKAGGTQACVLQSGGHDLLRFTVPADTECVPKDGSLSLSSQHRSVYFWVVKDAKTVDEAIGHVNDVIKGEFKNLKVTDTKDLTVADAPAKRQEGSGEEADDGDAGKADVVVFKKGDQIFVACVHGESLNPAAQEWMTSLLQEMK
jgi:hypothetical protein